MDETLIDDLQRQLSAKDDLLTETRLEALSSASQMQALREQVAKLRSELRNIKKENEELKIKLRSSPETGSKLYFSAFQRGALRFCSFHTSKARACFVTLDKFFLQNAVECTEIRNVTSVLCRLEIFLPPM